MDTFKIAESRVEAHPILKTPSTTPHQVIIEPARGWSALRLNELWEYRDLLYFTTLRDLRTRYRQTALGPLWIIIQPLFNIVIYTIIFGVVAKFKSGGVPYQVFSYCALLPWDFFNDSLNAGTGSLVGNRDLISKVYFPRLIIPLSKILSAFVDFLITFVILVGMLVYYRITPNWGVVLLPFFLLMGAAAGLGFGLLFSGLIVKYRDFGNVASYFVRALMYASPVVYSSEIVPPQLYLIYHLNPMANVLEGFRWALLGNPPPNWTLTIVTGILSVVLCVAGMYQFRRVERNIVDVA